jgi:tetratricopeptide (TPR) repeat protein
LVGLFNKNKPQQKLRKFIKEKKYAEALKYSVNLEQDEKYRNDTDIAFIIGTIHFLKGDIEKTLSYMNKVLEIAEYDIDALVLKASILADMKNKKGVIKCCDKIKEIDPKNTTMQKILYQFNEL